MSFHPTFDENSDCKFRSTERPFKRFLPTSQGCGNRMLLFAFRIGVVFQLRGGTEVYSLFLNFILF